MGFRQRRERESGISDVDERRTRGEECDENEELREVEGGPRELASEGGREREKTSGIKEGVLSHPTEGREDGMSPKWGSQLPSHTTHGDVRGEPQSSAHPRTVRVVVLSGE